MGKQHVYTVKSAGKESPHLFHVTKFDPSDFEPIETYQVTKVNKSMGCSCPAHTAFCRHMNILLAFQEDNRVDSGWFYSFDKKQWYPPLTQET